MKKGLYKLAFMLPVAFLASACTDFLDKEPLGQNTEINFFNDPDNAVLGINSIYDAASWDEGPNGAGHTYDWMFGDVLSSNAEKGSAPSDFQDIQDLKDWRALATNGPISSLWINQFTVVYRANTALYYLPNANINQTLKNRLMGEAHFMRAYGYYHLARLFGGLPLFKEPVKPSEFGNTPRATFAQTFKFIEDDLAEAARLLPEKSQYGAADLGRATKGAAKALHARIIAYQLGTDNSNNHTWQKVYDLTSEIVNSGQYSLMPNFAQLFEDEGENGPESILEIQFGASTEGWGPIKIGTTNNIIQNCRCSWGWGFNNPTAELVNAFEAKDPRRALTAYKDGDIVLGTKVKVDYPKENSTGYLSRKAAVVKPAEGKASPQNIRKIRFAEVLLLHAEAAYYLNRFDETRNIINQIRARAKQATLPKGSKEGSLTYDPISPSELNGVLNPLAASVSGPALLDALRKERRLELAMEALYFWDEVRWGTYLAKLPSDVRGRADARSIKGGVNPIPVLPIPLTEVESWKLQQNPGY